MLGDLMNNSKNPTVAPYAKTGQVELRITAKADTVQEAKEMLKPMEEKIISILGDKVYGRGIDNSMENVVVQLLRDKKLKLRVRRAALVVWLRKR